jgi:hypothetical protein
VKTLKKIKEKKMKVKTVLTPDFSEEWGGDKRISVTLTTDEVETHFSVGRGEPEDMTLDRDLEDAYAVPDMLRAAYEAGKRGEPFEEEETTEEE